MLQLQVRSFSFPTLRFKINGGLLLFYFDPPFINFINISFRYCKRLRNILEIPMLSEVNKVFKDNPDFVSSLLYFVPPTVYFDPPFKNFSKSLYPLPV